MSTDIRRKWSVPEDFTSAPGGQGKAWLALRKTFEAFRKRKGLVLLLFLIACALLSGFHYVKSLRTASTVVSLEYEEAARGLTPSQTRFNIFEVRSAEVMDRLIDYAGLRGVVTAEELSDCVTVGATHDRNVSGKVNFISTSYQIEFTDNGRIPNRTADAMLSLLCKSYREFFVEHYGVNHSILNFDISGLKSDDEYLMAVDLLELKCEQLRKYVQLCQRSNKNYQDPDTGLTFSALEQRISNFFDYDLARLRSFIIENGIANDKPALNALLDYKIRMDSLVYDKLMAAYEEDNSGIRLYDPAMSAIVMIPTEDVTMRYYMSRTKTGMDNMALHADAQLLGATERTKEIEYNRYLIEKMRDNRPQLGQREKADEMIRRLEASLESLASDIRAVDQSFASYKARNYLSFHNTGRRFLDRAAPADSAVKALLLLAAVFAAAFLRNLFRREKER